MSVRIDKALYCGWEIRAAGIISKPIQIEPVSALPPAKMEGRCAELRRILLNISDRVVVGGVGFSDKDFSIGMSARFVRGYDDPGLSADCFDESGDKYREVVTIPAAEH